jgi:AhpD family alkylhydroperoxidase
MPVMSDAAPRPPTIHGRTSFVASLSPPGALAAPELLAPFDVEKLALPLAVAWFVVVVETGTWLVADCVSSAEATEAVVTATASTANDRAVFIIAADYKDPALGCPRKTIDCYDVPSIGTPSPSKGENNMSQTRQDVYREVTEAMGIVPKWLEQMPDGVAQGFWVQARDFWLKETKIPNKYKELIGIAVSGATRCKYCVLFHTEAARLFGASDEEIAEASAMGALTMMASTFVNAQQIDYEEFRKETKSIVNYIKSKK